MKAHLIALLIAAALTGSLAAAAHAYGSHSTPGIRLMLANLPGIVVGLWVGQWIENDYVFYALSAVVNWVFYFYLIKGAMLLKRKLSS
ncbi:MAG: hypothetical protein WAN60_00455 [Candidatus Sulfotelmatobacter sp.]|jgi:hypothetical protein